MIPITWTKRRFRNGLIQAFPWTRKWRSWMNMFFFTFFIGRLQGVGGYSGIYANKFKRPWLR